MDTKLVILFLGALVLTGFTAYLLIPRNVDYFPTEDDIDPITLNDFMNYMTRYHKHYPSKEEAYMRIKIFQQNVQAIEAINNDETNTYKAGVNQFTDMTQQEFAGMVLMNNLPKVLINTSSSDFANITAATAVDWRTKGAVTPVKNQGQCGSCWSFSATGVLEGTSFIQGKKLQSFSEQQLVDCCGPDGFQCQGCQGALPEWGLDFVKAKGIVTEQEYPYVGQEQTCKNHTGKFKISSYTMLPQDDEITLKKAVTQQPVSICVDASTWYNYVSGIYNKCDPAFQIDLAALLVGYVDGQYYIIKNAWDVSWGEKGYIRLPIGNNACGVANHAVITSL